MTPASPSSSSAFASRATRGCGSTPLLVLLAFLVAAMPVAAQKPKPDPKAKPAPAPVETKPVEPPAPANPKLKREVDSLSAAVGQPLTVVEGKYFDFAATLTPADVNVLMDVADKCFAEWTRITGVEKAERMFDGQKCLIVVCKSSQQYKLVGPWYEKTYPDGGAQPAMQSVTYFPFPYPRCMIAMHLKPADVNGLKNNVAHEIGHMLIYRHDFNYNFSPVWLTEGFGSWLEGKVLGLTNCYCSSGGYGDHAAALEKMSNLEWAKWKAGLKASVKARQDKNLSQIIPMQLSDMSTAEVGKAWSVVDYMVSTDAAKFTKWLSLVKKHWPQPPKYEWYPAKGEAQKKALQEAWGIDINALDDAWRTYVDTRY